MPIAVQTTSADVLFNGVCGSGTGGAGTNSAVCKGDTGTSSNNPLLGSGGLLVKIAYIIAAIAGIAAVIVIIVSGMRFITSGGDPAKAQAARGALIGALIGIVVIVLATTIISFVLSKVN
jgi:hypothetical protein